MTRLNQFLARVFPTVIALTLSACGGDGSNVPHANVVQIDSQFQSTVDAFTAEAQAQGNPIVINDLIVQPVEDLSNTEEMGTCIQEEGSTPVVQISQSYWDSLDADSKQELLFHELGHCVLNRTHEITLNNGVPTSVMSPEFFGSSLYNANKAQYLHELFTGENVPNLTMIIPQGAALPDFSAANGF